MKKLTTKQRNQILMDTAETLSKIIKADVVITWRSNTGLGYTAWPIRSVDQCIGMVVRALFNLIENYKGRPDSEEGAQ